MSTPVRTSASLALVLTLALGCTTTQGIGAATGAAAGAISGAAIGGNLEGALVGAAVGAALGWGAARLYEHHVERTRVASEDARIYGYRPGAGPVVKIRDASVEPRTVARGQKLDVATDYSVNVPAGASRVSVTESLLLEKDGKTLYDFPAQTASRESGGWVVRNSFDVPKDAEPGTYVVVHRVATPDGSEDRRDAVFVVRN